MIPIVIVAHPAREAYANRLAQKVHAEAVCWDVSHIGCARNHISAWRWLADYEGDWGVVLEDDVLPCPDFYGNLARALTHAPAPIVSLYTGRGRPPQYQQPIARVITQEVSYIRSPALLGTQGYAVRTELLWDFDRLAYYFGHQDQRKTIELLISAWATRNHYEISHVRHSLVEHLDGPSLVEDHGDGRGRGPGTKTDLMMPDCDPSGAELPEIRKAWLLAGIGTDWTLGSVALEV